MVTKFCTPPQDATQKMLFGDASEIKRTWFLALPPDILKTICNLLGTRKGMDVISALDAM